MSTQARFKLGNEIRVVGRWFRLILGVLLLIDVAVSVIAGGPPLSFLGEAGLYLIGVSGIYLGAYYWLGERLLAKSNPWLGTLLLVVPALVGFVPGLFPEALRLALGVYIGVSLVLNFAMSYGGCEVLAIPTLIFKRRYTVYCPSTVVDVIENAIAGGRHG